MTLALKKHCMARKESLLKNPLMHNMYIFLYSLSCIETVTYVYDILVGFILFDVPFKSFHSYEDPTIGSEGL